MRNVAVRVGESGGRVALVGGHQRDKRDNLSIHNRRQRERYPLEHARPCPKGRFLTAKDFAILESPRPFYRAVVARNGRVVVRKFHALFVCMNLI